MRCSFIDSINTQCVTIMILGGTVVEEDANGGCMMAVPAAVLRTTSGHWQPEEKWPQWDGISGGLTDGKSRKLICSE